MRRLVVPVKVGLLIWALAVTAARATRWPNDFAESHWLLDYRFGFIKRGLVGSVMSLLARAGLVTRSASAIATLSFILFGLLCLALLIVAVRLLVRHGWRDDAWAIACVFVTSPFVVLSAHFMGYLDHVVVLAMLAVVWLSLRGHPWWAGAVAGAGVLVHENFVTLGLPLLAVSELAGGTPAWQRRWRPRRLAPLMLPLTAFGLVTASEELLVDRARLRQQLVAYLSGFPFVERDMNVFLPEWLTTTGLENLRAMGHAFGRHLFTPDFLWAMGLPTLLIVAWAAGRVPAASRVFAATAGLMVALAPLSLHAVALDTARIWAYPLVCAFAFAWWSSEAAEVAPSGARPERPWWLALAVPVLLLNMFIRLPLMDGQVERFSTATRIGLYGPIIVVLPIMMVRRVRASFAASGGAAV